MAVNKSLPLSGLILLHDSSLVVLLRMEMKCVHGRTLTLKAGISDSIARLCFFLLRLLEKMDYVRNQFVFTFVFFPENGKKIELAHRATMLLSWLWLRRWRSSQV